VLAADLEGSQAPGRSCLRSWRSTAWMATSRERGLDANRLPGERDSGDRLAEPAQSRNASISSTDQAGEGVKVVRKSAGARIWLGCALSTRRAAGSPGSPK